MVLERDDDDEVGVAQDLLRSLGHLKGNYLAHHPLGGKNISPMDFYFSVFQKLSIVIFKNSRREK